MPSDPPEVWPPPVYAPAAEPPADDPRKVARQQAALGWTFLLLGLLAPPVFLPFALFYGWKSWRGGEAVQGRRILCLATLLIVVLAAAACWLTRT